METPGDYILVGICTFPLVRLEFFFYQTEKQVIIIAPVHVDVPSAKSFLLKSDLLVKPFRRFVDTDAPRIAFLESPLKKGITEDNSKGFFTIAVISIFTIDPHADTECTVFVIDRI